MCLLYFYPFLIFLILTSLHNTAPVVSHLHHIVCLQLILQASLVGFLSRIIVKLSPLNVPILSQVQASLHTSTANSLVCRSAHLSDIDGGSAAFSTTVSVGRGFCGYTCTITLVCSVYYFGLKVHSTAVGTDGRRLVTSSHFDWSIFILLF